MASAKALLDATLAGDSSKASPPLAAVKAEGVEAGDGGGSNGKPPPWKRWFGEHEVNL